MGIPVVTLATLNNGAAGELFDEEFRRVLANIADPSTRADAERTITLRIKIKPSKDRSHAMTEVACATKLTPITPHEGIVMFGYDGSEVVAYTSDIRQTELGWDDRIEQAVHQSVRGQEGEK